VGSWLKAEYQTAATRVEKQIPQPVDSLSRPTLSFQLAVGGGPINSRTRVMVKFQQRYVKSHRKVPPTPSHLPCDLSWLPASTPEALPADVCSGSMFFQVLLKSLPQSVLAPWCAVLTAGFPKVWANIPRLLVDPFVLESREPPGVCRCGGTRLGDFLAAHQLAGRV